MTDVNKLLEKYNLVEQPARGCGSCEGYKTKTYVNIDERVEFRWRYLVGSFLIKRGGIIIYGWAKIINIEKYLNEVFEKDIPEEADSKDHR